jgi:hypothetical protein
VPLTAPSTSNGHSVIVVGGVYRELCARPRWDRIFGSGGRAISAIATLSPGSELHGYAHSDWIPTLQASGAACGYTCVLTPNRQKITFEYLHPMAKPKLFPAKLRSNRALRVSGDVVLRFGLVEGDAIVSARRAVYDPQTGIEPKPFFGNGSTCDQLAVVLNAQEAFLATKLDPHAAGPRLIEDWDADVVVIKLGTDGALVFEPGKQAQRIEAFRSERVFKIGSGDVFSALFAHCWGELDMSPATAAARASAAVAQYVETRSLPFADLPDGTNRIPCNSKGAAPYIYLAGPFFDVSQRWLIEESMALLEGLGADVFSPIHHVGSAETVANVAAADLDALRKVDVVLAFVDSKDPGTIFEIGFASALKKPKPVIILAERLPQQELTMFTGSNCFVTNDYSTALYRAMWAAS